MTDIIILQSLMILFETRAVLFISMGIMVALVGWGFGQVLKAVSGK